MASRIIRIQKSNIALLLYGFCVFIYALLQTELAGQYHLINTVLRVSFVGLAVIGLLQWLIETKSINTFATITFILIALVLSILFLQKKIDDGVLLIILFMLIVERHSSDDILQSYSVSMLLAVLFTLFLWSIHILPSLSIRNRKFLGFYYASYGPNMLLHASIAYVSFRKRKMRWTEWIILTLLNTFMYVETRTIAPILIYFVLMLLCFLGNSKLFTNWMFSNRFLKHMIPNTCVIIAIATIVFQIYYNQHYSDPLLQKLNTFSSFRLSLGRRAFQTYPINLIGHQITWNMNAEGYFYVDSSYLNILFTNGILTLALVCIGMDVVSRHAYSKHDYYLFAGVLALSLHCMSDPQLLSFRYNPFLLLIIPSIRYKQRISVMSKRGIKPYE